MREEIYSHTYTPNILIRSIKMSSANIRSLDKSVLRRYLDLPQPDNKILATFIWIDGTGENLRGKD